MAWLLPLLSLLALPFVILTILIIILASSGKSLGIRKFYVSTLLKVFEVSIIFVSLILNKSLHVFLQWGKEKLKEDRLRLEELEAENDQLEEIEFVQQSKKGNRTRLPSICAENISGAEFQFSDPLCIVKDGIEAIVVDEVTTSFDAAGKFAPDFFICFILTFVELPAWNMLTRTNQGYQFLSFRLAVLWTLGFIVRYFALLPLRAALFVLGMIWLLVSMGIVGYLPDGELKKSLYARCSLMASRILARTFSAIITFHNEENRPQGGGICVANHTSPIDAVILMTDSNFALVGQKHGGILGIMQQALNNGARHIWFERGEMKDRTAVAKRLKDHVEDPTTMPVLIFPEGTCVNNTSIFMFKKGAFEIDCVIYPVAIKYNPIFGDPFWNSGKQSMMHHIILMMTSWAIVCDVWYLPPTKRKEGETAVEFANRVKSVIARQGGLVDLEWDGGLKRSAPKPQMRQTKQKEFSNVIKRRLDMKQGDSIPNGSPPETAASARTS